MTSINEPQVHDRAAEKTQQPAVRVLDHAELAAIGGGTGNVHDAVIGTVIKWGLTNMGFIALTHNGGTILIAP